MHQEKKTASSFGQTGELSNQRREEVDKMTNKKVVLASPHFSAV